MGQGEQIYPPGQQVNKEIAGKDKLKIRARLSESSQYRRCSCSLRSIALLKGAGVPSSRLAIGVKQTLGKESRGIQKETNDINERNQGLSGIEARESVSEHQMKELSPPGGR